MGIPLESKEDASNGTSKGPLLPTASRRNSANPSRGTSAGRASRSGGRLATDSIGHYLSSIGRVPLLTAAEEIELAHHVQAMKELLDENLRSQMGAESRSLCESKFDVSDVNYTLLKEMDLL